MSSNVELVAQFITTHGVEAGRILERFPPNEGASFLSLLSADVAGRAIKHMGPSAAAACLDEMPTSQSARVLAALSVQSAAELLRHVDEGTRDRVLGELEPRNGKAIRQLLRYPEATAGAIADPLVLALPADLTVQDAQQQVTRSAEALSYYIYIVDRDHHLVGVLDVRELFLAPSVATLNTVMHPIVTALEDWMTVAGMAAHPGWQAYDALPVVDRTGVFIGAIMYRTLRRMLADSLPERPRGAALLTALFNLGELYWVSLAALLPGASSVRGRREGTSPAGGDHD